MGKFDGVLLASDFDDTLCGSRREVSAENIAAIKYFVAEGGRFTIATGRAHQTFAPCVDAIPINAPVILANGAQLYDYAAGRTVFELPLPARAAGDLAEMCRACPRVGVEVYHGDEIYVHNPNEYTARHVQKVGAQWTELPLEQMPQPWIKALLQAERAELEVAWRFLTGRWSDIYEVVFSNDVLLECTAKGATKGGMALRLAELLGVERKDLYCIGDNENDLPMLAVSAIPFAPMNCADVVRASAPRLVRHCDDHAVAHAIEILDGLY